MMNQENIKTSRLLKPKECLDGTQEWKSSTHASDIGGEIHVKPHLPGIIIFVHGVNSEGEWYEDAEKHLCEGLNKRLNLPEKFKLKANEYYENEFKANKNKIEDSRYYNQYNSHEIEILNNSPIVRFYWGYRSNKDEIKKYDIPLKNKKGDSYLRLEKEIIAEKYDEYSSFTETKDDHYDPYLLSSDKEKKLFISQKLSKQHGIFYWNGGPFQNGTNQLVSLWSEFGFNRAPHIRNKVPLPLDLQWFNPESDRILASCPPRHYYAHAVGRLAKLIKMNRENNLYDTVSVISHSQGTMIALAAAAIEAPDALFVLNSPYALHDYSLNAVSYPPDEQISAEQREATLQAIINKVAKNKDKLKDHPCGYKGLVVGLNEEGKSWSPKDKIRKVNDNNATSQGNPLKLTENDFIQERDNHGRTYIYCNPHDRVMGASPLHSIGWNGIPNVFNCKTKQYSFSPFFTNQAECTLYVRILGRNIPCGAPPDSPTDANKSTIFCDDKSQYCDGTSFWENNTKSTHYMTWPKPDKNTKIYINGPEVPNPIQSNEMLEFDETYTNGITDFDAARQNKGLYGYGFGQVDPIENKPIDSDYYYLIDFYDYDRIQIPFTEEEKKARRSDTNLTPNEKNETHRFETLEESRERFRTYIQRGTDHSSLPKNENFLKRVVAYDLPIGYCEIGKCPEKMNELRKFADWQSGLDIYMEEGKLDLPEMPKEISNPDLSKIK
ncbi:hypothetical protein AALC12_04525 [Proteus faecis]|nr:hypothetical protein [Proteus faecis]